MTKLVTGLVICMRVRHEVYHHTLKIKIALGLLCMIGAFGCYTAASGASFDCAKAKGTVETAICGDQELSELDNTMAKVYADTLSKFSNAGKQAVKNDQRIWAKARGPSCSPGTKADAKKFAVCLKKSYNDQITWLTLTGVPRNGVMLYRVSNATGNAQYDQIDEQDAFSQTVNAAAKKQAVDYFDTLANEPDSSISVAIEPLTNTLYQVSQRGEFWGGAHPSFSREYMHFSKSHLKALTMFDVFDAAHIKQVGQLVFATLAEVDPESKGCTDDLTPDIIVERMQRMNLDFNKTYLSVGLDIPHVCQAVDFPEVSWEKLMPFLTSEFKAEIAKLKK